MEYGPGIDFPWIRQQLTYTPKDGSFRRKGLTPQDKKDAGKRREKKRMAEKSRKRNKR